MQVDLNETFASPEKWRLKFYVEYIKVCTLEIKAWRCSIIWEEENRVIHIGLYCSGSKGSWDLCICRFKAEKCLHADSADQTSVDVSRLIKECATDYTWHHQPNHII